MAVQGLRLAPEAIGHCPNRPNAGPSDWLARPAMLTVPCHQVEKRGRRSGAHAMKMWQILGYGKGFLRANRETGFSLDGFVYAESANEAFDRAIALAKREWPEIAQVEQVDLPRPVINAGEIVEVKEEVNGVEEGVELLWD